MVSFNIEFTVYDIILSSQPDWIDSGDQPDPLMISKDYYEQHPMNISVITELQRYNIFRPTKHLKHIKGIRKLNIIGLEAR